MKSIKQIVVIMFLLMQNVFASQVFDLIADNKGAFLYYSGNTPVVKTAVDILIKDSRLVCAQPFAITERIVDRTIIIGVPGSDAEFDRLLLQHNISYSDLQDKWEGFKMQAIGEKYLFVIGSDARGAAYGVLELSRKIGVSPWIWWADVVPQRKENVQIDVDNKIHAPSVQYRGVFINDEGWGLWPWAKYTFDPEFGDIGPRTYEKIFEVLLRLRANYIWPGMHPNTKTFQSVAENRETARRYGVVVGSSHAEPLLFNNAGAEWNTGVNGPWDYTRNRDEVMRVLENRVKLAAEFENIYTMGMRGIHDSRMQGVSTSEEAARLLEKIFEDQRNILSRNIGKQATEIPQVFIPYKEVMEQYNAGMIIPEDITLMWANDNHGFIRNFSNEREQQRSGRGGVYYHLSYLGAPHPYLWLSPVFPSLIFREMTRARQHKMDRIWIGNVGDLKRREWQMEFFLDLAWDDKSWTADNIETYFENVASRDISPRHAKETGSLMWEYYRLATERKPEFMGFNESQWAGWPPVRDPLYSLWNYADEVEKRIRKYQALRKRAKDVFQNIPTEARDTYFQLVYYPIAGAAAMNEKWLFAFKSREYAKQGRLSANTYSDSAFYAFSEIIELTRIFNEDVANGKWNHITSQNPGFRNGASVFLEPITARVANVGAQGIGVAIEGQATLLTPQRGALPEVATRNSIIKLNPNDAKLYGALKQESEQTGESYIIWHKAEGNRIINEPRYDVIPYVIPTDSEAVFDFYFDAVPGGEHTIYLSVDYPDRDSDSWWVKFNDRQPVQANGAVGRTERLKVSEVVLDKGWNRIIIYPRKNGAKLYGVEFAQEGRQFKPNSTDANALPKFNKFTQNSYFIDVFSFGSKPEDWTATTSAHWIELSKQEGVLTQGGTERILVSVNYANVPTGAEAKGFVEIDSEKQTYRIDVTALNSNLSVPTNTYVEDNGLISMQASGYNEKRNGRVASWRSLHGLGRSGSAMITEPVTGWYVDDLNRVINECPSLEYDIVALEGGAAQVIIEAVPSFPLNVSHPLKCAISIDGQPAQWVVFDMGGEGSRTWQNNVLESRMTGKGELTLEPGKYKLKLWGTDPSVNVDKIMIDFGGLKPNYAGPDATEPK